MWICQGGFGELGHAVRIVSHPSQIHSGSRNKTIILGANLLPTYPNLAPSGDIILFNLEQAREGWMTSAYLALLRNYPVWDYSTTNIEELKRHGIEAAFCPIGYAKCLERVPTTEPRELDVLFYGSDFGRRTSILDAITNLNGLVIGRLFNVYGGELDTRISQSRVVLNLRAYDSDVFNIVRCSYLLANRCCVVSEATQDPDVEDIRDGIVWGTAEELPALCERYVKDDTLRHAVAQRGYELFKRRKQSAALRKLL